MIKYLVGTLEGVGVSSIVAMLIFFALFVIVVITAWKMGKSHVKTMSNMPLESSKPYVQRDEANE